MANRFLLFLSRALFCFAPAGAALWLGAAGALAQTAPPEPPVIYQVQPGQNSIDTSFVWLLPPAQNGGAPITKLHSFYTHSETGDQSYSHNVSSPSQPVFPIDSFNFFIDSGNQLVMSFWAENTVGLSPTLAVTISTGGRAPTAPRNLRAETLDGEISLFWNIPITSGGTPNTYYTSQYRIFYGGSTTLTMDAGEYVHPGLQYNIGKFAEQTVISVDTSAARGISIWARNVVGWGPVATTMAAAYSAPVAATTAPGAPVSLTVHFNAFVNYEPQMPGQVRFFPPTVRANLATGFYILYNGQSVDISHTAGQTGQKTRNLTGLTRGNTLVVSVVAKGASGNGPAAVYSVRVPATIPRKVSNLRVIQSNEQQVVFTFDPPTFWGGWGPPTTSPYSFQMYRVNTNNNNNLSGLGSGIFNANTTGNATVTVIQSSSPGGHEYEAGRRYSFRILSQGSAGNNLGDLIYFTIPGNPSPPQSVRGEPRSGAVVLSWDAPADWGGGGASDNARIVYGVATGTVSYTLWHSYSNPADIRPSVNVNPITINKLWIASNVGENLINGVAYKFQVRAISGQGNVGTLSAPITVTPAVPSPPSAVQNLSVASGDRQFVVTWDAPSSWGSSPQMDYIVTMGRLTTNDVYTVVNAAITLTTHSSHSDGVLNPADTYRIQVVPRSQAGLTGPLSQLVRAPGSSPDAPNVTTSAPASGTELSVSWSAADSESWNTAATAYALRLGAVHATLDSGTTATVIGGLQGETAYPLSVWGLSPTGAGAARVITATTAILPAPGEPRNFTLVSRDARTGLVLAWEEPSSWAGSSLSVYRLQFRLESGSWDTHETTDTRHTITTYLGGSLDPWVGSASQVEFRILARSHAGLNSQLVNLDVPQEVVSSPNAPIVTATALAGGTQISVGWSPANNSGATAYALRLGAVSVEIASATTATIIGGLQGNTAYTLSVWAINGVGNGGVRALTLTTMPPPPDAPVVVATANANGEEISLSWSANANGSAITAFLYSFNGGAVITLAGNTITSTVEAGLAKNRPHTLSLAAVNAAGTSAFSQTIVNTPATNPTPPQNFTVAEEGNGFVVVDWEAPADWGDSAVGSYRVVYAIGNGGFTNIRPAQTGRTLTVSGLANGQFYRFIVQSTSQAGLWSDNSPTLTATPVAKPSAPTIVAAANAAGGLISISWSAADNGSAINAYLYSFNGGEVINLTHTLTATVEMGLAKNTSYTISMAAANANGTSAFTAFVANIPATPPSAPRNVTAYAGNGRIILEWDEPADWGGSALSLYRPSYLDAGTWSLVNGDDTTGTRVTQTGLTNGTDYSFHVLVQSRANLWHETFGQLIAGSIAPHITISPIAPPDAPTLTAAVSDASASVYVQGATLTWAHPRDNGTAITGYVLQHSGGNITLPASATAYTPQVTNGQTYAFTLLAYNSIDPSAGGIITITPFSPPGEPQNISPIREGATAAINWSAPARDGGFDIVGYRLVAAAANYATTLTAAAASLTANITNLPDGIVTAMLYAVSRKDGNDILGATASFYLSDGTPSAPINLSAAPRANGMQVDLAWGVPISNFASITAYIVSYGGMAQTLVASARSAVVGGLALGQTVIFTVRADSALGVGLAAVATATTPNVPQAPASFAATAGFKRVVLSWQPPPQGNNAPITGYTLTYNGETMSFAAGVTAHTVTGLTNGTTYGFTLQAANGLGAGAATVASATPQNVAPDAPHGLQASVGDGFVVFEWNAPANNGGATISEYVVYVNGTAAATINAPALVATLSMLTDGTTYTLGVAAVNSIGEGQQATTTQKAYSAPGAPTGVMLSQNGNELSVGWQAPADDGGDAIIGYEIYVSQSTSGGEGVTIATAGGNAASATGSANNLSSTIYYAFVRARNRAGFGAAGRSSAGLSLSLAALTPEKQKKIDNAILPAVASGLSRQWSQTINERLGFVGDVVGGGVGGGNVGGGANFMGAKFGGGKGMAGGVAKLLKQHGGALANGKKPSRDALQNANFSLPLAAGGGAGGGGVGGMGVWGGVSYSQMENKKAAAPWDGKNIAYYGGIDSPLNAAGNVVGGVMFSHNRMKAAYELDGRRGEYEFHANVAHPYFSWTLPDGGRFWGGFGYGAGEVETREGDSTSKRDAKIASGVAGFRAAFYRGESLEVDGLADWSSAAVDVSGGANNVVHAFRALLEMRHNVLFVGGGGVSPFAQAGIRNQKDEDGMSTGWEAAGGLRWSAAEHWSGELRARAAAAANNGAKEWGASAMLRRGAANRRGFSFSLAPRYGGASAATSAGDLWSLPAADKSAGESPASVAANLGYGVSAANALWQPYISATLGGGGARAVRAGAKWESLFHARLNMSAAAQAARKNGATSLHFRFTTRY